MAKPVAPPKALPLQPNPRFALTPTSPIAILLLSVPTIAVLQFRAIALVVSVGLLVAVVLHRRLHGRFARPSGAALAAAMALGGWTALSALWAPDPWRALGTGARFAGFVLLGAAAARAVAEEPRARLLALRRCLWIGLAIGIPLALVDHLSGNAIRAAVRGLRETPPNLGFGLKSAVAVIAVLLPVAAANSGIARPWRVALVATGLVTAWLLPAESAKLAAVAGIAAMLATWVAGRRLALAAGIATAAVLLAAPLAVALAVPRLPPLEGMQFSAAHRVLIWDFARERIAERPAAGWGGESSRVIPGGTEVFPPAVLDRFGLVSAASRHWFALASAQRLPLHAHNAGLQIWLELGVVGAAIAAWLALALGGAAARARPAAGAVGAYAAAAVIGMLSFGVWQEWWIAMLLLVVVALSGLTALENQPRSSAT